MGLHVQGISHVSHTSKTASIINVCAPPGNTVDRGQERLSDQVRKPKRERQMPGRHHHPPQMGPPQYLANCNLQPANLPHHLLPSTPVNLFRPSHIFHPRPGILYPATARAPSYPATARAPPYPITSGTPPYPTTSGAPPYPTTSGAPPYPTTSGAPPYPPTARAPPYPSTARAPPYPPTARAPPYPPTARAHLHSVPMSLAGNPIPYSCSNSYPVQQTAGIVSPQQYPGVLPYSVGRSPPYRQMSGRQDQPPLLPYPPIVNPSHPHTSSIANSQMYGAGHNTPTSYIPSNPGLPSRNTSAPTGSRQLHDSQHEQRRPPGKRNRRKTTQQGNN